MLYYNGNLDAEHRMKEFLSCSFSKNGKLPLSFIYNGISSKELLCKWSFAKTEKGISFTSPDGMIADIEIKIYSDFPAVEWLLSFENCGNGDSDILSNVNALDLYAEAAPFRTEGTQQYGAMDNILYYNGGSDCKADDFLPCEEILHHISARKSMHFECIGGRPTSGSHGAFPYFNLKTLDRGLFFALGWSGQWHMDLECRQHESEGDPDSFRFSGGMSGIHTILHPGEKIRTARVLLMLWDGTIDDSHDLSRQFMLKYHAPQTKGTYADLPISVITWGSSEVKNKQEIDDIKKSGLPVDTYWVDAGWYGPSGTRCDDPLTNDWYDYVGWFDEDLSRYPDGMKGVSQHAHDNGLRFLLWHEPDRASLGTKMLQEHPEYYLPAGNNDSSMLDLGREDAYQWMLEMLSDHIRRFNMDMLRIDYNFAPLGQWRDNDTSDRQGMTEIRAVTNFYRLWDELHNRFPNLLIDNCASGGRRLDFEACSRSVTLYRTDFFCYADCTPAGVQMQTAALAPFIPLTGVSLQGELSPEDRPGWYEVISGLSAGMGLWPEQIANANDDPAYGQELNRMLETEKRFRQLIGGDFHVLTRPSIDEKDWFAYELFDKAQGKGCIVSVRRKECPVREVEYKLRFVKDNIQYLIENAETGEKWKISGKKLLAEGLTTILEKQRTASVLFIEETEE